MNAITVKQAKKELNRLIEQVIADAEPTIICSEVGEKAVLLSMTSSIRGRKLVICFQIRQMPSICASQSLKRKAEKTQERDLHEP